MKENRPRAGCRSLVLCQWYFPCVSSEGAKVRRATITMERVLLAAMQSRTKAELLIPLLFSLKKYLLRYWIRSVCLDSVEINYNADGLIKHTLYPSCIPVWMQNLILHLFFRTLRRRCMFRVTFNKYTCWWPSTFHMTSTCKTVSTTSNKSTYQRIQNTQHPSIIFIHLPPPVSPVLGKYIKPLWKRTTSPPNKMQHRAPAAAWNL